MNRIRLFVILGAALTTMATQTAWGASTPLAGHTPLFTVNHLDLGVQPASKPLRLRIWLKGHQADQLKQAAEDVRNPQSPNYRKFLTKAQVDAIYKSSDAEVARVQAYLQSNGLKNIKTDPNKLYVEADAVTADAARLFQVQLHRFVVEGQTLTANTSNPQIDNQISDLVSYVGGLSTQVKRPMIRRQTDLDTGTPTVSTPFVVGPTKTQHNTVCFSAPEDHKFASTSATAPQAEYAGTRYGTPVTSVAPNLPPCGYGPAEIQAAYGVDKLVQKGLDGTGQTIVIIDAFGSPTIEGDAADFSQSYGLPVPQLTVYQPAGPPVTGVWNTDQQGWAGETTLDVEYAHVMAPGAKIALVEAMSDADSDLMAAIAYAVENNLGNAISNSWSGPESQEDPASMALAEAVLQTAVARGFSVHFSSGDDGDMVKSSTYEDVGYPSSSAYVTSVGGTSLALNADHSLRFQTGWGNDGMRIADGVATPDLAAKDQNAPLSPPTALGFVGGAGGGPSRVFAKPAFQKNIPGTSRMQPDIAYLADPFTGVELVQSGFDAAGNPQPGKLGLSVIGGTSLACPMFSAMWSIANQAHGSSLGQAAPLLYKLPKSAIIDILPVSSPDNVQGEYTNATGANGMSALMLATPETASPFFSALYNSPESPYRWLVISFGTDSSLQTATGWDNVTGLGVPNGANFIQALTK